MSSIRILRLKQVIEITGLSRSTIYAYMGDGFFPKQILLGVRSVGWVESDIEQWLSEKIG